VWSLNYEVLYYLAFLFIWWLRPKITTLFLGTLIVSIISWISTSFPQFIGGYASGWIFWLSGLWLAWKVLPSARKTIYLPLLSYIFLFVATNNFATGKVILTRLGLPHSHASFVNLPDLTILPLCVLLIAEITRRYFLGINYLRLFCFAIPVINLLLLSLAGRVLENPRSITSAIFTVAAIAFAGYKLSGNWLNYLAPIGRISYAIYLLHMPVMHLVHDYFPIQGTLSSFSLRLLVWFLITVAAASLLDLVMQPIIKRWFEQKFILNRAV